VSFGPATAADGPGHQHGPPGVPPGVAAGRGGRGVVACRTLELDDVLRVLDALERGGVRYALFGGLAMAAHGFDRATRDLALFVPPDAPNIERLRAALSEVLQDPDIAEITADDLGGDYPAVQYGPPGVDYTIDIVSRLGDAFRFEDLELERVRAGEVTITVVTPATLFRMKTRHRPAPRS
jgi:hypothetical protein